MTRSGTGAEAQEAVYLVALMQLIRRSPENHAPTSRILCLDVAKERLPATIPYRPADMALDQLQDQELGHVGCRGCGATFWETADDRRAGAR
jgi:hypothetical protein